MKRIGILGGTFNPVHIGHLTMAQMVCEQIKLAKAIFVPSYLPPHKSGRNVASAKNRYQMLKLAIKGNPRFDISDFEIKKEGKSYSIDTIKYLRSQYPGGTKFFFIIGSDLLTTLHTWKSIDELKDLVSFISVNRPGFKNGKSRVEVRSVKVPGLQTSSTFARQRLMAGKTVKYLVPDNVINFIKKNKIYLKG
jgi:nicotinate-nucleotide adenylyltransferase